MLVTRAIRDRTPARRALTCESTIADVTGLGLLEHADDLSFSEVRLAHVRSPLFGETLTSTLVPISGAGPIQRSLSRSQLVGDLALEHASRLDEPLGRY